MLLTISSQVYYNSTYVRSCAAALTADLLFGRKVYFQWKVTNGKGPFLTSGSFGESWQRLLTDLFDGSVVVIVVQSFLIPAIFQCHNYIRVR